MTYAAVVVTSAASLLIVIIFLSLIYFCKNKKSSLFKIFVQNHIIQANGNGRTTERKQIILYFHSNDRILWCVFLHAFAFLSALKKLR